MSMLGKREILDFVDWFQQNPIEKQYEWKTLIFESEDGLTARRQAWKIPRRHWMVNFPLMKKEERDNLVEFFNSDAVGAGQTFLIYDREDYGGTCTFTGEGETEFQLYKEYYGVWTQEKRFIKPDSVTAKINDVETEDYTMDYISGKITLGAALGVGETLEVSYEFYYEVSFVSDTFKDIKIAPGVYEPETLEVVEVL